MSAELIKRACDLEEVVRELHTVLYPERYQPPSVIAERGLKTEDGFYQWSPDTPEALADVFDRNKAELEDILNYDPTPLAEGDVGCGSHLP